MPIAITAITDNGDGTVTITGTDGEVEVMRRIVAPAGLDLANLTPEEAWSRALALPEVPGE